ncbi:MAG: ArsA family ATPase [candidate division NC10 bacterium]|nr:ArsA family ATPase [candidate division NC10 bacterium]
MRIILYTGKGGVGKTTVSAATALMAAERGHRTLVISTDPAHSLADAFDQPLGPEPTPITDHLWGQEINVLEEIRTHWGEVKDYLTVLFATRGVDEVIAEEMAVFPGLEELCSLLQIRLQGEAGRFDCLIVDCAPTGETMRLLSFPDVARWYMEKLFPWERRIVTAMGPIVQPFVPVPLPKDNVYAAIEALFNRIDGMKEMLCDPKRSSIRLVLNPEKMVIKEAQRALTYLNLYGYVADAVISNRVFPRQLQHGYFAEWSHIQGRYREMIQRGFSPIPIWEVPLFDREVVGLPMLERMGLSLFAERDPLNVWMPGPIQTVRKKGAHYFLRLKLPFLQKEEVSLLKRGDELVVSIGNFRRDLVLPRALADLTVKRARLEEGYLVVRFGQDGSPKEEKKDG